MSETYNIYETKTHLSKVLEQATEEGEVIIAKSGKPMWKITPISQKPERIPGRLKGQVWIAPDAFSPEVDAQIAADFYASEIFPPEDQDKPKRRKSKRR